jgi:diguanylate cyclase (GGDEF)-like protein
VLLVIALYMGMRTVVFLIDGSEGAIFTTYFNSINSALLTMLLIVTASIAVSILRAERVRNNAVGDYTVGLYSGAGVLSASGFAQAAADHVQRAEHRNVGLAVIGADIDKLPELNTAFGRVAGDQAISVFAQALRGAVPVMAVVGHPAAGRVLVLSAVASSEEAMELVERIQLTLVDEPLAESQRIRLTASFGLADTFGHGYDLDALMDAANGAVDEVKRTGGNNIAVAAIAASSAPS